ncbi:TPA: hypothetical protein QCO65_005256 [Bacillus cereus]|uniref:hypothetical protein n=1 Tax=Bacillus TaxID=1386 RepID=UPI001C01C631|nr:hypothetical protein [Bacillus mycoides]QWG31267.1 hypothetical protein EXW58_28010 [Bacillus mycoides]HDR3890696.1 hypothetical protein [Bacillus cereus]HDR7613737.1 hypothetical protein [Bacillus mycoides]
MNPSYFFIFPLRIRFFYEYESPYGQGLQPNDGDEIYEIVHGEERLVGIYDGRNEKFVAATAKN